MTGGGEIWQSELKTGLESRRGNGKVGQRGKGRKDGNRDTRESLRGMEEIWQKAGRITEFKMVCKEARQMKGIRARRKKQD